MKKLLSIMLTIALILCCGISYAEGALDVDADVTLHIVCTDDGTALSGVEFELYRVANTDTYGNMSWAGAFEGANITLPVQQQESWREIATTLASYIGVNNIASDDSGITDASGAIVFPTEGKTMKSGLYLVLADNTEVNNYIYSFQPTLVFLPDLVQTGNPNEYTWVYDVTANPKFEKEEITTPAPNPVSLHVLKVWEDGNSPDRPTEITVVLLKNGEEFDRATLNEANSWSYTWEGLDPDPMIKWSVGEATVNGYDQSVEFVGFTDGTYVFTIKNKLTPEEPTPTPVPLITPEPTAPPTGQLWWPVSVLAPIGVLLLAFGIVTIVRKKREDA